jgi:signal transduction histidine kinase
MRGEETVTEATAPFTIPDRRPSRAAIGFGRRLRDLPLFWKLLLPFLALIIFLGTIGSILVFRDLSSRAQAALNEDLLRRSVAAGSAVHDRELYVLEAVNFAANLRGMAGEVNERNTRGATDLLRSVLALKKDVDLLVATDALGVRVAALPQSEVVTRERWSDQAFIARALRDRSGGKSAGLLDIGGRTMLGVASPICSGSRGCEPAGVAIAAIDAAKLAAEALAASSPRGTGGVALFSVRGLGIASAGPTAWAGKPPDTSDALVRRNVRVGSEEVAVAYAPLEVQGVRVGTLAVSTRTQPAFASAQGARLRLVPLFIAALAGIIGIGILLSRLILAQLRPLVATNRALGSGLLTARAPVLGTDELGELATGLNQMAEQLQASVESLESRVEQRTQEIRRLMSERAEFFAGMSHELRTPVATILAEAQMLRDPSYRKGKRWQSKAGVRIEDAAGEVLAFMNDILALSKAEAGHVEVKLAPTRLADVVKGIRSTVDGLAKSARLRVRTELPADLPLIQADPVRLREIIVNLVENAVKYTPSGGRVLLAAAVNEGRVEVSISDTGVGIPPESRGRIFEPFFRVEGTSSQQGQPSTGLGLALTKRLVEAQGGSIWFTSEPGVGTTFTFSLSPAATDG